MKRVGIFVLSAAVVISLIATLPAALFIPKNHYLTPQKQMIISDVRGSIWQGQVLVLAQNQPTQLLVEWDTSSLCLLGMSVCLNFKINTLTTKATKSTITGRLKIPLLSAIPAQQCLLPGRLNVSNLNATVNSDLVKLLVPELIQSTQTLSLKDVNVELNLNRNTLDFESGVMAVTQGQVKYTDPLAQTRSTSIPGLDGQFAQGDNGFELIMSDSQDMAFIGILSSQAKDNIRLVIYDAFAQAFGAPTLNGGVGNVPRFEIEQGVQDLLCNTK